MSNKAKQFDMYKLVRAVIILAPFFFVFSLHDFIDNDTYWILKTGEYISNFGIPQKDFLTMHTSMDLVCQQWLSSVVFYKLYSAFGFTGLFILQGVMFCVVAGLMYYLAYYVNNNRFASVIAVFAFALIGFEYVVTRPQAFTYAIVLIEIICLEKYVKTGRIIHLVPLPILSILEVNLHASMWTMLFILMLPFFANALPIKIKGKSISCCKLLPLIISALVMVPAGLVTPYGVKGLSFIFTTSVGNKVNSTIGELSPFTLSLGNAFEIVAILVVIAFYVYHLRNTKNNAPIRYHLLVIGLLAMGLMYIKLFVYFVIIGVAVASYMFKDYKVKLKSKFDDAKFAKVIGAEIIIIVFVLVFAFSMVGQLGLGDSDGPRSKTDITSLCELVDELDKEDSSNIVLYNTFNTGGYLEFRGYTTYIDARADSFIIEANHDFDYLTEYNDVNNAKIYYKDFINKYHFNYFVLEKGNSKYMISSLSHDDDYEMIFENDNYTLFKTK